MSDPHHSGTAGGVLVLLHPLGVDRHFWDALTPLLASWRVRALDLPGHGQSRARPDRMTLESISASIVRQIESLDERVNIAGVSIGGLVAQEVAIIRPDLVDRLVLIDTVAHYPPPFDEMWRSRAAAMREFGASAIVEDTMAMWFTRQSLADDTPAVEYVRRTMLAVDPEGYAGSCEALASADTRASLPAILAPTLVLCGDQEPTLFTDGARELVASIPDARLAWLPGKHGVAIERPGVTSQQVRAFLECA